MSSTSCAQALPLLEVNILLGRIYPQTFDYFILYVLRTKDTF